MIKLLKKLLFRLVCLFDRNYQYEDLTITDNSCLLYPGLAAIGNNMGYTISDNLISEFLEKEYSGNAAYYDISGLPGKNMNPEFDERYDLLNERWKVFLNNLPTEIYQPKRIFKERIL